MSNELATMQAKIAELEAANAKLKAANERKVTLKVSEKGALSLYGMGRFPVTLYAAQWEKVLGMAPTIVAFMAANKAKLATKE
jgi:hypothetical protein